MKKMVFAAAAGLAALSYASAGQAAVVITAGGGAQTFTVDYNGYIDEVLQAGLTGTGVFSLQGVNTSNAAYDVWSFDATITNTSATPVDASRISILAFDLADTLHSSLGSSSGIFGATIAAGSLPQAISGPAYDICFRAGGGGGNCTSGGGNGVWSAVLPAAPVPYTSTLNFRLAKSASSATTLTFNRFGARYQSIDYGNMKGDSGVGLGTVRPPVTVVPEPSSWMLMILGFGLIAQQLRRRSRAIAAA